MRKVFLYLFLIPGWFIGAIFILLCLVFFFLCALVGEYELFILKILNFRSYKGRYYQIYKSMRGHNV